MDSQYLSAGWIAVALAAGVVFLVLAVLAGGAVMRLLVRWIGRQAIGYGLGCGVVLVGGALCWAGNVALILGLTRAAPALAAQLTSGPGQFAYIAVALVLDIAMFALAVVLVARGADGARIPPARALAIAAAFVVLGMLLFLLPVGLLAALSAALR